MKKNFLLVIIILNLSFISSVFGNEIDANFINTKQDFKEYSEEELNFYILENGFDENNIQQMRSSLFDKYAVASYIKTGTYTANEIKNIYNLDSQNRFSSRADIIKAYVQDIQLWEDEDCINFYLDKGLSLNQIKEYSQDIEDKKLAVANTSYWRHNYDTIIQNLKFENDLYVAAKIPKFRITINGEVIENLHEEYPFIVYNDITYFPLTYNLTNFMQMESNYYELIDEPEVGIYYDIANELYITAGKEISGEYNLYYKDSVNSSSANYYCSLPPYNIYIMGERVYNSQEKYPFFNCNGITYFPLTWENTVTRFGFESEFTQEKGLVINTK